MYQNTSTQTQVFNLRPKQNIVLTHVQQCMNTESGYPCFCKCSTKQYKCEKIWVPKQIHAYSIYNFTYHIEFCTFDLLILTHWSRVPHICVSKLIIIGSDNGLSPGRHQAIIWSNADYYYLTLRYTLQWNFNQNWYIFIQENAFENIVWKMSAILSQPQCVTCMVTAPNRNIWVCIYIFAKSFISYK